MFSFGWFEILFILVLGLIVIGPERLPGLIKDIRAVALAFRNLVADAREQLDQDLGPEFDQFKKPLQDLNNVRQMGARGFITKTLFDDDDSFLTSLDQTGKDVMASVDSVRSAALGQTPAQSAGAQPSNVEVAQQADAGESWNSAAHTPDVGQAQPQGFPQPSAGDGKSPVAPQAQPSVGGQETIPEQQKTPPPASQASPWDDVL